MIKKWQYVSRKILFQHPRLTLLEDTVRLPNGKTTQYFLAAPPTHDSVSVIALGNDRKILVQKQYNYPIDETLWELPGGRMEGDETPAQAAVRELAEEAGFTASDVNVIGSFYTQNRFKDAKQHVVLCQKLRPYSLPPDDSEFIETDWLSYSQIKKMVSANEIKNINMLASLMVWHNYDKRA